MKKEVLLGLAAFMMFTEMKAQPTVFNEMNYVTGASTVEFSLKAPPGNPVTLRLYGRADAVDPIKSIPLFYDAQRDEWWGKVEGSLEGMYYAFEAGRGETPGLFAKAVSVNGKRGAIVDLAKTNPVGWAADQRPPLRSPADLVIYELHHRDFSIDPSSGIVNKGKFLALTEPRAINHLRSLGVNAVHLLPSYDFGSIDETRLDMAQYNWGYDPVNYNVPEGSYSTNPYDPACRIREFKQMVQALHRAGIRVILDVVYNHTYDIAHSNFQRVRPDYFYRQTADGRFSNGSGCGNETASERELMRQFMIESVLYWIREYHIDGFRFDLMGVHDIETMNAIRAAVDQIDPTIFIYGEGWSAGTCAYPAEQLATKANVLHLNRIAAFSDELRDALRGPFNNDSKGAFLIGLPGEEESVKFGIAGCISHPQVDMTKVNYSRQAWAAQPTQMISYVSCHDDMCLVDRLKATLGPTPNPSPGRGDNAQPSTLNAQLIRLDLLAQTAVFTSQGVPFLLSGEEMLRDKKGVHNSYNSPDNINRLDWNNLQRYPHVFDYYRRLIALRAHHPAFRLGQADLVRRHLEFLPSGNCLVAFRLKDHAGGDAWGNIVVVLNANANPQVVSVPKARYTVVCCDGRIDENGLGEVTGSRILVPAQSALILHD